MTRKLSENLEAEMVEKILVSGDIYVLKFS